MIPNKTIDSGAKVEIDVVLPPLLHRVRELYEQRGVSSVIVMGGSGDYFDVADTVVMMDSYEPRDVTDAAKALADPGMQGKKQYDDTNTPFGAQTSRRPGTDVLNPARGNRDIKINTREVSDLMYGEHKINLLNVEQLIDIGQTRSIGLMIYYFSQRYAADCENLVSGLKEVMRDAEQQGLDIFSEYKVGNLALPRLHELAAAINRIREGHWK